MKHLEWGVKPEIRGSRMVDDLRKRIGKIKGVNKNWIKKGSDPYDVSIFECFAHPERINFDQTTKILYENR